ncbi:MAG: InlB B-repeat-containing protein, partial [Lachnospiraceae bacterium]|nr:InlB B-repeat-containing protein [Lachnospiraceae bacterium]
PEGLKTIGPNAFKMNSGLTEVVIPDSLESINTTAFDDCTGLTKVTFKGSMVDWYTRGFDKVTGLNDQNLTITYLGRDAITVPFESEGGSAVESQTVQFGEKLKKPADPTRDRYKFIGWYTEPDFGGTKWDFDKDTVKSYMSLYAAWSQEICLVSFNTVGGSPVSTVRVAFGEKMIAPEAPTRKGYAFDGWYKDSEKWDFDNDRVDGDIGLTARWRELPDDEVEFTVSFNSNGGTKVATQSVQKNSYASRPTEPTRGGYYFDDWYKDEALTEKWDFSNDKVTEDTLIYAKWIAKGSIDCTVTFNSKGGTEVAYQVVKDGQKISKPKDPVLDDYYFLGWSLEEDGEEKWDFDKDTVEHDITLYAVWEEIQPFAVTFATNGGSSVESQSVMPGEKVTKPSDPTMYGYTFAGWFKDEALTSTWNFEKEVVTKDTTLYAGWIQNKYTVSFDSMGGAEIESVTVGHGDNVADPGDPVRSGYIFAGWYYGEEAWDFDEDTVVGDMTLEAHWNAIYYTVTFVTNAGSLVGNQRVQEGAKVIRPSDPTRYGYTFRGWYTDEDFLTEWNFDSDIVTGDMTLYARWETGVSYKVTFNSKGGSSVSSQTVKSGEKAKLPAPPTRAGYTFDKWYEDFYLEDEYDFDDEVTEDITLYAGWVKGVFYKVEFETNSEAEIDPQMVPEGGTVSEPVIAARKGYKFDGWFTEREFLKEWDFSSVVSANMILYAKWTEKPLNSDGDTISVNAGGSFVYFPSFVTFKGMNIKKDLVTSKMVYSIKGDTKVYAKKIRIRDGKNVGKATVNKIVFEDKSKLKSTDLGDRVTIDIQPFTVSSDNIIKGSGKIDKKGYLKGLKVRLTNGKTVKVPKKYASVDSDGTVSFSGNFSGKVPLGAY